MLWTAWMARMTTCALEVCCCRPQAPPKKETSYALCPCGWSRRVHGKVGVEPCRVGPDLGDRRALPLVILSWGLSNRPSICKPLGQIRVDEVSPTECDCVGLPSLDACIGSLSGVPAIANEACLLAQEWPDVFECQWLALAVIHP